MTDLISLCNVTVRYGRHVALHDVSGSFHAGSLTAIAGPNGAGKSTLLKLIVGIVKPRSGHIDIDKNLAVAYLPQTTSLQQDFPMSALQTVCTGFWPQIGNKRGISPAMKRRALDALAEVG